MEKGSVFNNFTSKVPGVIFQFKLTPQGKASIPYASERMLDVFGIQPCEVTEDATPIFDIVHPDDLNSLQQSIDVSVRTLADWEYAFRILKNGKELRWLRGVAKPEVVRNEAILWHGYIMDVTSRFLVEQENLQTRIKYEGYFENARDGLFVVNRNGYFAEANPAACQMTGYSLDDLLSMHVRDLVDPAFNEEEKQTLDRSFELGSIDEEALLRRKNGESFWVRLVTSKIDDKNLIAFCHDITLRKLQEKQLAIQLDFQKMIASISSKFVNATSMSFDETVSSALGECGVFFRADRCYVFLCSPDYQYVTNTHEWCSYGVSPQIENLKSFPVSRAKWWWEQLKNKRIINIPNISTHQEMDEYERQIFIDQQIKSLLSIPMINNGVLIGFFGLDRVTKAAEWSETEIAYFKLVGEIVSSIFSKSRAENALRESENRYRLLAENARDVIFRISLIPEKRYEYISPSSVNLTGYAPGEYYENSDLDIQIIHPDDRDWFTTLYGDTRILEKPLLLRIISKQGNTIWCEQSIVPIRNENNELIAIEGIARDVTRQKEFELKLQVLNTELLEKKAALESFNRSLEERIAEEVEKNRSLDQLMALQARQAALGELIANIAHQWRQPLNVLSLAIYDLADAYDYGELDRKYLELTVEQMNRVIQDMSSTIDDFRSFFKPQFEKSVFSMAEIINKSLSFLSPYFRAQQIQVCKDLPSEIMIDGYSSQLEQVVVGLLKNALDALENFKGERREIGVTLKRIDESTCMLVISNTGKPVSEKNLTRIFDPYFTTKSEGKGIGLGLYIAKIIVERNMGGSIYCENFTDGVSFVVKLQTAKPA
jgi:PAS domain S-box-containing protein